MGDFVKAILDKRHIKRASMGKAMGVSPQAVTSYLSSKVIGNEVLMRMSEVLGFDIHEMVVDEQARRNNPGYGIEKDAPAGVSEPVAVYKKTTQKVESGTGFNITISPRDYDVDDMVRILRFLDSVPLRNSKSKSGAP